MELVIERAVLLSSLSLVQGIVERRNTVPILGHVLLEPDGANLRLAATDLEVGIRTEIPCRVDKKGSLTLNARKLFEIVREAEGGRGLIQVARQRLGRAQVRAGEIQNDGARSAQFPGDAQPGAGETAGRCRAQDGQGRPHDCDSRAGGDDRQDHLRRQPRRSALQPGRRAGRGGLQGRRPDGRDGRPSALDDRTRGRGLRDGGQRDHSAQGPGGIAQAARPGGRGAGAVDDRRAARVAQARRNRGLDAPGRGRISRLPRRNPQAIEVRRFGRTRRAAQRDKAGGDFLQRALSRRQAGARRAAR